MTTNIYVRLQHCNEKSHVTFPYHIFLFNVPNRLTFRSNAMRKYIRHMSHISQDFFYIKHITCIEARATVASNLWWSDAFKYGCGLGPISPGNKSRANKFPFVRERALARLASGAGEHAACPRLKPGFDVGVSPRNSSSLNNFSCLSRRCATMVKWRACHARSLMIFKYLSAAFIV